MSIIVGVDGCKAGWVAASCNEGGTIEFALASPAALFCPNAVVAIDMPIGLPDRGPRACDLAARRLLSGQGSRVFPVPCRAALVGETYVDCCTLNAAACGKRLSKQTHAILPKIREVDRAMTPAIQKYVREAHPEVSFRVIGGVSLQHRKKTSEGQRERMRILDAQGLTFDPFAERARLGAANVEVDELLDAAACLATARRIAAGVEQVFGDRTTDARGLRMEIVA